MGPRTRRVADTRAPSSTPRFPHPETWDTPERGSLPSLPCSEEGVASTLRLFPWGGGCRGAAGSAHLCSLRERSPLEFSQTETKP